MTPDTRKKRDHKRMSGDRGFTLVEVLATFVLIALIIPTVMEGISLSMKLGVKSKHQSEACTLAESKLAELIVSGDYEDGDQEGEFDDDADYTWSLTVDDWEEEDSMQQLILSVDWTDTRGTDYSVALTTLVYTASESEEE